MKGVENLIENTFDKKKKCTFKTILCKQLNKQ